MLKPGFIAIGASRPILRQRPGAKLLLLRIQLPKILLIADEAKTGLDGTITSNHSSAAYSVGYKRTMAQKYRDAGNEKEAKALEAHADSNQKYFEKHNAKIDPNNNKIEKHPRYKAGVRDAAMKDIDEAANTQKDGVKPPASTSVRGKIPARFGKGKIGPSLIESKSATSYDFRLSDVQTFYDLQIVKGVEEVVTSCHASLWGELIMTLV